MTTHDRESRDHEQAIDEQRWQAQERAFLSARRDEADAEPADLRIARALRQAPPIALPSDFAVQVGALARAQAAANSLFEQRLLRGLVLLFALSAAVVVAWQGRGWVTLLADTLPGGAEAVGWSGIAAVCLLANWGWGALRRQFERGSLAAA